MNLNASCPRCGISGLHACPGKKIQAPTPEQEAKLKEIVDQLSLANRDAILGSTYEEAVAASEASDAIPAPIRDAMVDTVTGDTASGVE